MNSFFFSLQISEEEAVELLAVRFGVLLMAGSPFGAVGHLRLSYGSIPPADAVKVVGQLQEGFRYLQTLSEQRRVA
jgi:aspartate/methionine/tyrosine aminotransferase